MRNKLVAVGTSFAVFLALVFATATPAAAEQYEPVRTVHTERVHIGPYGVTVGFSAWPLRAMQSLDFTFAPDGGIVGKTGTITMVGPGDSETEPLGRHPRKRSVWGLDIRALPTEGVWALRLDIRGSAGHAVGTLKNLTVLAQPGPPILLSWAVSTFPLLGLIALLVVSWLRFGRRLASVASS